jgi:hypothetical protein
MEYQENCIHLKACRRLCKIFNKRGRGCNENCTAYENNAEKKNKAIQIAKKYAYYLDDDNNWAIVREIEDLF